MIGTVHNGGCRCGAVSFVANAEPHFTSYCHCGDCRRATGAPVVAFVGFMRDEIEWQADGFRTYGDYPVARLFCPDCGAPIGYRDERLADRIYFYTAAMAEPERFAPTRHAYAGEQLSWLQLADDLPRKAATTVERTKKADVA